MDRVLIGIAVVLGILVVVGIVGLRVPPQPFPPFEGAPGEIERAPLPEDLPEPVLRFYRAVHGDDVEAAGVPVITSAVVSGRATLRIMGVRMPGRFRFTHEAGEGYRHYIETTFFGLPLFRVNEWYLDGRGRLELPFGVTENEPNVDRAANQGLWAETAWFPAVFVTDPRVRWTAVDDETAILTVPYGDEAQTLVARFDPETGLLRSFVTLRYKDAASADKTLWITETQAWGEVDGHLTMTEASLTWLDEGTPWAVFETLELVLNADVEAYVRDRGL